MSPMKQMEAKTLPTDVYLSFVSSLFGNRGTLVTGVVVHVVWCFIVFSSTGSVFYLAMAASFMAVFAYRMVGFAKFDKMDKQSLSRREIAKVECGYVVGAALTALLLGIASGYALLVLQNTFAAFTCIAMTLGSMMSIVGRNYGSRHAVDYQTMACCLPIMGACLLSGQLHLALMSLLLIPFGLTTRSMAMGVRDFLYENVIATRDITVIAGRFDTALKTMAHGLVMLDGDGKIEVINRQARDLLHLDPVAEVKDRDLVTVLQREAAVAPSEAIMWQVARLAEGAQRRALLQFGDGRHLEFSASHRSDGGVVLIFEDVSARVATEEKILHMVRFDALTALPNRGYFSELATGKLQTVDENALAALLVLDVDGFKHVNDMRGHVVGDRLLAFIGMRMAALAGDDVVAGRLIGDEFVLLIMGGADRAALEQRIRDLHARIQGSYPIGDLRLTVSMNGGCVIDGAGGFDMENWQIRADLALNDAKSRGNGTLTFFREEMDARYVEEQKLRADLRQAIEDRGLYVVYQPMYRPDGSQVECFEALVRWKHPEKGLIGPNVFIPLAEDMALVSQITRFVIEQACRDCASWKRPIPVSVNLSIHDLQNSDLVAYAADVLSKYGLEPSRLHLEVTESCFMNEPVAVSAILNLFRAKGVTIAIDDFGTGFSSLSYLHSLPLDIVKIDRAFVKDIEGEPRHLKLLSGIVHLSRELGLKVVLEGVETEGQLALINQHDFADLVQGYVFSPPVPADAIEELASKPGSPAKSAGVARRSRKGSQTGALSTIG